MHYLVEIYLFYSRSQRRRHQRNEEGLCPRKCGDDDADRVKFEEH